MYSITCFYKVMSGRRFMLTGKDLTSKLEERVRIITQIMNIKQALWFREVIFCFNYGI